MKIWYNIYNTYGINGIMVLKCDIIYTIHMVFILN